MKKSPEAIGVALKPLLARLDPDGHFEIARLVRIWPEAVGPQIAKRTEVASLKFHTAVVKVASAMWIHELNLMRGEILARLAAAMGTDAVRELRFVLGSLSRGRSRLRLAPRAARRAVELPELKDPDLQAVFARLIEAWGRAPR